MQNLNEVYQSNPATSLQNTDLFYLVRWPYLPEQGDMAITWADILSAILYAIGNDEFLLLSGGTMSGPINMGNNEISELKDPVDEQDAATKNYTDSNFLQIENNLSDLKSASTARTNLGLGTASTHASTDFLQVANNLSDVNSPSTARTNLGLGSASTHNVGEFLQVANNLSDLPSASTARTNLGLGTSATHAATDFLAVANNLSDLNSASIARTNLGVPAGSGTSTGTNTGDQTSVSGNAGSATTTATTDDTTTNATVYLVWKTAATGNLDEKVSSTKMSFNPSTGMLTVIGVTSVFIGNLTGNVTGNVSGSSGSCSGNAATATLAANVTTNANLTGPVTSTGNATAIANGAISNAMLANSAVANLSGTNTGNQTITLTGDVTGSGVASFAATIGNNVVTYAKMQQASTVTLLGNPTGGTANIQQITLGTNLSFAESVLNATGFSSPLTTKGDLLGYSTTNARVPAGSNNQVIVYDSTQDTGINAQYPTIPMTNETAPYFWDFLSNGGNTNDMSWGQGTSGTGASVGNATSAITNGTIDGQVALKCANLNSFSWVAPGQSSSVGFNRYLAGGQIVFEARVFTPTVSTAAERYQIQVGLVASSGSAAPLGCYFTYKDDVNSGQWTGNCKDGGGTSTATGGSAIVINAQYRLTIVVNAAASSVSFYVNGTLLGTAVTGNIPTATALSPFAQITKTAITSNLSEEVDIDYIFYQKQFSTPR